MKDFQVLAAKHTYKYDRRNPSLEDSPIATIGEDGILTLSRPIPTSTLININSLNAIDKENLHTDIIEEMVAKEDSFEGIAIPSLFFNTNIKRLVIAKPTPKSLDKAFVKKVSACSTGIEYVASVKLSLAVHRNLYIVVNTKIVLSGALIVSSMFNDRNIELDINPENAMFKDTTVRVRFDGDSLDELTANVVKRIPASLGVTMPEGVLMDYNCSVDYEIPDKIFNKNYREFCLSELGICNIGYFVCKTVD